jgi:hypothetical protein
VPYKNSADKLAFNRRWYAANRDKVLDCKRERYAANRDRLIQLNRQWREANHAKVREYGRRQHKAHPDRARVKKAKRRALKLRQICDCCTVAQIALEFYSFVEPGFTEVDHIVPLAVGGLHCRKNLQLLTVLEHKAKTRLDRIRIAAFQLSNKIKLLPARVA